MANSHTSTQPPPIEKTFELGGASQLRKAEIECPACRTDMVVCEIGMNEFAGCPACKGMLFQQPVFAKVSKHLRNQADLPEEIPPLMDHARLKAKRMCHSCGARLQTHSFCGPGKAVIDTCFRCGVIFLNAGELTKLVRAPGK
ncbi:zf-TFIIB domain-containing protein [bacterium]|nr:zf-TFIIB domain-containing protein [bacterium]